MRYPFAGCDLATLAATHHTNDPKVLEQINWDEVIEPALKRVVRENFQRQQRLQQALRERSARREA